MTIPMKGDRAAYDSKNYPELHSSDLLDGSYFNHVPRPSADGKTIVSLYGSWVVSDPPGGTTPKLDDLNAPDDNTDLNATSSAHGLMPKLSGDSGQYIGGDGTWHDVGTGGGGSSSPSISLFMNSNDNADLSGYRELSTTWQATGGIDTLTGISTDTLFRAFTAQPNTFKMLVEQDLHVRVSINRSSIISGYKDLQVYVEIHRIWDDYSYYDDLMWTSDYSAVLAYGVQEVDFIIPVDADTEFEENTRIAIEVWAHPSGSGTDPNAQLLYGNSSAEVGRLDLTINEFIGDADTLDGYHASELGAPTTAANDVQVGDGSGNWIKKTISELKTILQSVTGLGLLIPETNATEIFQVTSPGGASQFTAKLNGDPTDVSNSVCTFDTVTAGSVAVLVPNSSSQLAKIVMYNTTRSTSALVLTASGSTFTTTTNVYALGWRDNDDITITSAVVSGGGFSWIDLKMTSGRTGASALFVTLLTNGVTPGDAMRIQPYTTYSPSKQLRCIALVASQSTVTSGIIGLSTDLFSMQWNGSPTVLNISEQAYLP